MLIDVFDPVARSACWMLFEVSWAPLKLALNFLVLPAMLMACKRAGYIRRLSGVDADIGTRGRSADRLLKK